MKIIIRPEIVGIPEGYRAIFFARIKGEEYLIILCPEDHPALATSKMVIGKTDQLEISSIPVTSRKRNTGMLEASTDACLTWRDGIIEFNGKPLTEIYFNILTNNRFKS